MIRSMVIGFFAAIAVISIATYVNLKAYKKADIFYEIRPSMYLVYKEVLGDYIQTSVKIEEVERALEEHAIVCEETFGLFWDDPGQIATQDLKSWVGCRVSASTPLPPDTDLKYFTLSEKPNTLMATFEGSPTLGPRKVYAEAQKLVSEIPLFPSLELYRFNPENQIVTTYYFSIEQAEN